MENIKKENDDDESKKEKTEKNEKGENEKDEPLNMEIDNPHHKELQEQAKQFSKVTKTDEPSAPDKTSESNILLLLIFVMFHQIVYIY